MNLALDLVKRAMPELKQDLNCATTLPNRVVVQTAAARHPIRRLVTSVRIIITYTPPNILLLIFR